MRRSILSALTAALGLSAAYTAGAAELNAEDQSAADGVAAFLWDPRISGVLRADYFRSSRLLDGEKNLVGATVQVKALPRFSAQLDGKIELRASDPALGKGAEARGQLLEGYL